MREESILYRTCVAAGTARTALACCIIVAAGLPLSQGRAGEERIRPMGYLTHPFFGDMPSLAGTEATAQLANIFVWRTITPEPQALDEVQQDFASAEAWLTESSVPGTDIAHAVFLFSLVVAGERTEAVEAAGPRLGDHADWLCRACGPDGGGRFITDGCC